ncbi:MAG: hypothetical protein HQ483_08865 [Rhodospirillales bacterium]|nr:hypothetical protein [Rhodospirillales bacterium]
MVSISTFEDVKSNAVMNSLSSTFATLLPRNDPTEFTAKDGDVFAAQQFQDQVSDIFSAAMQVAKVEIVQPGERMRASFPIDSMFANDTAELRPVSIPLLDRIVAALSGSPPGLRFEMEFVIGATYLKGNALPTEQTLALSRAGNFAREMAVRGVPPGLIAVGVEPGDPRRVTIWFYIRNLETEPAISQARPVQPAAPRLPAN